MTLVLSDLLTPAELAVLQQAAAGLDFESGARTAGAIARGVKQNEQASDSRDRAAILAKVEAALMRHPVFLSAARPRVFVRLMVSRYGIGQAYGAHVDDAIMGGGRTDLSFTLFLSAPEAYDGGALIIGDRLEDRAIKLAAGEAVLYPSDSLHRVDPVTRGTRLAVVGWVQSLIRDAAKRDILMGLDEAIAAETRTGNAGDDQTANRAQLDRLAKTRSNLIRMWAEM